VLGSGACWHAAAASVAVIAAASTWLTGLPSRAPLRLASARAPRTAPAAAAAAPPAMAAAVSGFALDVLGELQGRRFAALFRRVRIGGHR
jgi:hypothetical protein